MIAREHLRTVAICVGVLVVLAGVAGGGIWYALFRRLPSPYDSPAEFEAYLRQTALPSDPAYRLGSPARKEEMVKQALARYPEEHFKYGSIGTEEPEGIPYWIWFVLPRLFPEFLPGPNGLVSLGVSWEEGHDMPIGFPVRTIGFPRVGVNCATCHVTQLRTSAAQEKPVLLLAGPSQQLDVQAYQAFLFRCANDPRWNAGYMMPAIEQVHKMPLWEKMLLELVVIPQTKTALVRQGQSFAWQHENGRPLHGRGRVDPFNPMKFRTFKFPDDGSVGNADIPAIWNQKPRAVPGFLLHWDGLSARFAEVAISSAIGDGTNRKTVDLDGLAKIQAWLDDLPPPRFADHFPANVDPALAARGKPIYDRSCADCHAFGGKRTGTIVPLAEVGTDPNRTQAWTQGEVDSWKRFAEGYPYRFETFAKYEGYVSAPLDGIWLRAPYLHNGSVPSLRELLEPAERRTRLFYRGYNVYDPGPMGWVSQGAGAAGWGTKYDVAVRGNGNGGHLWGTDLPPADKDALVEYLKTL